jgi:hypothetical protein
MGVDRGDNIGSQPKKRSQLDNPIRSLTYFIHFSLLLKFTMLSKHLIFTSLAMFLSTAPAIASTSLPNTNSPIQDTLGQIKLTELPAATKIAQWQGALPAARYGIQRGAQWCATNVRCSVGAAGLSRPSWGEINGAAEAYRRDQWNNPSNAPGKGRNTIGGYSEPRGNWYNPRSW